MHNIYIILMGLHIYTESQNTGHAYYVS